MTIKADTLYAHIIIHQDGTEEFMATFDSDSLFGLPHLVIDGQRLEGKQQDAIRMAQRAGVSLEHRVYRLVETTPLYQHPSDPPATPE